MSALREAMVTVAFAVLAGASIYESHRASTLATELQSAKQREDLLVQQVGELRRESDSIRRQVESSPANLSQEPSYLGKPLSYWVSRLPARLITPNGAYLEAYPQSYETIADAPQDAAQVAQMDVQARIAVKALGVKCLPSLLRRLDTKDDSSDSTTPSPMIRGQVLTALFELGPEAQPAVPTLLTLTNSQDAGVKAAALHALQILTPDVPACKRR